MEAYSKSRTADAISDLSKLRPSEAFLVAPSSNLLAKSPETPSFLSPDLDVEKGDASFESLSSHAPNTIGVQKIDADLLEVGDIVRVQVGATPPADGSVVAGGSAFNESSLTGEARPIKKALGDQVFLGTINMSRAIDVRVDVVGGETMSVLFSQDSYRKH